MEKVIANKHKRTSRIKPGTSKSRYNSERGETKTKRDKENDHCCSYFISATCTAVYLFADDPKNYDKNR